MNKSKIKKAGNLTFIMMLLTMNILLIWTFPSSLAGPAAIDGVGWDDDTMEIEIGDIIATTVWGNAQEFAGYTMWNLTFRWDPGIVNVSNVWNGDPGTWGSWALTGGINNASGWVKQIDALTGDGSNVTGNYTLFNITFVGVNVGYTNLTFVPAFGQAGIVLLDGGGLPITGVYRNASITVYPEQPASLGATAWNTTAINLTFTPGTGGDNVTLCGKEGSYPSDPTDSVLYNGSLTKFNHTSLNNCTTYYYRAWSWNKTAGMHSLYPRQDYEKTDCLTNFTFSGVNPTDASKRANCSSYNVPVNLTITNSHGHAFNWWINCSDGSTFSGTSASNGSKGGTMSGLSHNTIYYWNVTASDATGTGDKYNKSYWFKTGIGGGSAPTGGAISPTSGQGGLPLDFNLFSVVVTDADGDTMNVTFYWGNDTEIGNDTFVASGGTASITPTLDINYSTRYFWHAIINDTCQETRVPSGAAEYWFETDNESVTITKECQPSLTNSSIRIFVNITNNGEVNLTDLVVNETFDTNVAFWKSSPAQTGDYWWNVNYLNVSNTSSIIIWANVTACANGTTISNTVNVSNATLGLMNTTTCGPYTVALCVEKSINETLMWNTSFINFTINVTNCGDIYLSWIQINETYSANVSYWSSNIAPNSTNGTFNITGLAPGATATLYIRTNTSYGLAGDILINQSRLYNNITVRSNQTTPEVTESTYTTVGARTETLRISYNRDIPDLFSIGNQIFAVIGAIMILGTLLILVYLVNKSGGMVGGGPTE